MVKEDAFLTVDCPSCKADVGDSCVDRAGVTVPTHVPRKRRWRILTETERGAAG